MMMVGTLYCTKRTSSSGSIMASTSHLGRILDDVANLMSAETVVLSAQHHCKEPATLCHVLDEIANPMSAGTKVLSAQHHCKNQALQAPAAWAASLTMLQTSCVQKLWLHQHIIIAKNQPPCATSLMTSQTSCLQKQWYCQDSSSASTSHLVPHP